MIITKANLVHLKSTYNITGKLLGKTKYSHIFEAHDHKNLDHRVAIQSIPKKYFSPKELINFYNEINILNHVDHPNIVKILETYEDKHKIYVVMELCDENLF